MTELDFVIQLWPVLTTAGCLVMGWLLWFLSKTFVNRKAHEELKKEVRSLRDCVDEVGDGLARLGSKLDSLPAASEVNRILLGLEEVRGTQREIVATINGQQEVLKRIEHPVQLLMAAHMDRRSHA